MRESSIVVRPQPMGSHTYTESSRLQAAGLRTATARFEEAARSIAIPRAPQPIAIADYGGAATGYNSLLPIGGAAIDIIRKRTRTDHAILVAHTDVPGNDFTTLFSTLADDQDSYLKKGFGHLRLGGGPVVLQPDPPPLGQHRAGLEFVGDPLAAAGADADSRPHRDLLQHRRRRTPRLRPPGRRGLARLHRLPRS